MIKLLEIGVELCELVVLLGEEPAVVGGGDLDLVDGVAVEGAALLGEDFYYDVGVD